MDAILDALRRYSDVVLVSHINPDGDAVGSLLGLTYTLEQLGTKVTPVLLHGVPSAFQYLLHPSNLEVATSIPQPREGALLIVLDACESFRTGDTRTVEAWSESGNLAFIDHHPGGNLRKLSGDRYFQNTEVSSTCELVYHIAAALHVKFTAQLSTSLLTGIYTDTGGFHYSNTSAATLEVASELMRRGASLRTVVREAGEHRTLSQLRLIGVGMERLKPYCNGRVIGTVVTQQDVASVDADQDDLLGITGPLTKVDDGEVSMVISEIEDGVIRGSFRSNSVGYKSKLTARSLALLFNGGGHTKAAGFRLPGTIKKATIGTGVQWSIEAPEGAP